MDGGGVAIPHQTVDNRVQGELSSVIGIVISIPIRFRFLIDLNIPASYCLYNRYALVMQAPTWVFYLFFVQFFSPTLGSLPEILLLFPQLY